MAPGPHHQPCSSTPPVQPPPSLRYARPAPACHRWDLILPHQLHHAPRIQYGVKARRIQTYPRVPSRAPRAQTRRFDPTCSDAIPVNRKCSFVVTLCRRKLGFGKGRRCLRVGDEVERLGGVEAAVPHALVEEVADRFEISGLACCVDQVIVGGGGHIKERVRVVKKRVMAVGIERELWGLCMWELSEKRHFLGFYNRYGD
ncbi:hypothetical protein FH972_001296 [Carpinus fangiana]|uniref:Uncharacterized protein n=1 Tax=Carpinus fangiana TaxID=176857 RepID=A0A5N6QBN0_9ROSI|nr:hypothetical protein FH972_001296 [Carpinus fangiana]